MSHAVNLFILNPNSTSYLISMLTILGEMACALPVVNGAPQEWALAKRHESEDIFGVQLCGNNANLVSYAAQVLTENCQLDFVDLNLGCPIDLIFEQGGGSALLRRQNILEVMIRSCVTMLDVPLTVKTRTGIYANKSIAHELVPKFEEWGASLVTVSFCQFGKMFVHFYILKLLGSWTITRATLHQKGGLGLH